MAALGENGRSPTFVVGSEKQRGTLDALVRREQHFSEQFSKNKPLCFNARAYQETHPNKIVKGQKDADATLCSPMLVAVADGVSQIEEFGIDASELPNELLNVVEDLAMKQLLPGKETEPYCGPISLMREAYETTTSMGSTTILTAIMDNSTKIHGKLHPMIAVCSVGDCQIIILRRGTNGMLQTVFQTDMQRIDGNAQQPLQIARVDDTVDPDFDESIAIEVIERGSAVHCISAFEGDIVIAGSDGVFDNLFVDEIVDICDNMLPVYCPGQKFRPAGSQVMEEIARALVAESHAKTRAVNGHFRQSPIGFGGKVDDTSCLVGQVLELSETQVEKWARMRNQQWWRKLFNPSWIFDSCAA